MLEGDCRRAAFLAAAGERYAVACLGLRCGFGTRVERSADPLGLRDAKSLGDGAAVDFGQFGHLGAMVEIVRVPASAIIPAAQWCRPLRRQHSGRSLVASTAKSGAASEKLKSRTIEMASARRIFT